MDQGRQSELPGFVRGVILSFLLAVCLTGCGRGSSAVAQTEGGATALNQSDPNQIQITSDQFQPAKLTIKKGTTVTWVNLDVMSHRIVTDPYPLNTGLPAFDSKQALTTSQTYQFTFDRVGEWPYHDQLRPVTLTGLIIVTN